MNRRKEPLLMNGVKHEINLIELSRLQDIQELLWQKSLELKMASFYAEDGSLKVNNGTPALGRKQLAESDKFVLLV